MKDELVKLAGIAPVALLVAYIRQAKPGDPAIVEQVLARES